MLTFFLKKNTNVFFLLILALKYFPLTESSTFFTLALFYY